MDSIKIFLKNINVLNLVLLAVAILLFLKLDNINIDKKMEFALSKSEQTVTETEAKEDIKSATNYQNYSVITEKNLFHPSRRIKSDVKQDQQMVRPEIILYGTLITDEKRIAYIEDVKNNYSTPGRGKRQVTAKEGDMIAGYKLVKVSNESILLVNGSDKITINLNKQKDRKPMEISGKNTINDPSSGAAKTYIPSYPAVSRPLPNPK